MAKRKAIPADGNIDSIAYDLYAKTLDTLEKGIATGAANIPMSLTSLDAFFDILHGGAKYPQVDGAGNEALPSVLAQNLSAAGGGVDLSPSSPYYTGVPYQTIVNQIKNPPGSGGLATIANDLFLVGAADAANVLADANVPTIFPKLLSDQFMARFVLFRAQIFTTVLFTNVGTGLKTYVEAAKSAVSGISSALGSAATDAADNQ